MKRPLLAVLAIASSACAQIDTRSTVAVEPITNAQPLRIGEARKLVGRSLAGQWSQANGTVEVSLTELRRCRSVEHQPVERVETLDRAVKNGGLYWEYGTGAAILALGIAALAKPEAFSPSAVDTEGNTVRDTTTGLRIGGVFTRLGAAIVGVGVYDTVRSRDEVVHTPAYRVALGDEVPCLAPEAPKAAQAVTIEIGPWSAQAKTNATGVARFGLPNEAALGIEFPSAPEPTPAEAPSPQEGDPATAAEPAPPTPPKPVEVDVVVTVGDARGRFPIVAPLADETAVRRSGLLALEAPTTSPPSPRTP